MSTLAFSLVVLAGLIHACWNIAAKKAGGDARFSFFSSVWMALIWAPVGLWAGWSVVPRWGWVEWGFIGASAVLHVVYFIVLLRGYRYTSAQVAHALRTLLQVRQVVCHTPTVLAGLTLLESGGDFADGVIAAEGDLLGGTEFVSFDQQAIKLLKAQKRKVRLLEA